MKFNKKDILVISIALIGLIVSVLALQGVEEIPTHININGEIDGYGSPIFLYVMWLLPIGIIILMNRFAKMKEEMNIKYTIATFFILINVIMFNVATTLKGPDMGDFALLIGGLLIVLGYQSKGVKINRHTGFKTPWSMKDEDNWNYTNYIGGNLMMLNGVIIIIFSNLISK